MRAHNLLKKMDKKLWIIVTSDKNEEELGLDKLAHNRMLFVPKPFDSEIMEDTVNVIAEWKAYEESVPQSPVRKLLAYFLGREG